MKEKKENLGFKIICPFCNQPFNAKMLSTLEACDNGNSLDESTYATLEGKIEIYCNRCKRLVYKKESYDF